MGGLMMILRIRNEWSIQVLVLLSFTVQVLLHVLAGIRRREASAVLRFLLWLAYLMADSTAIYTLGHLSISGWSQENYLVAFWAPFLLLHLGSQDTISAYALEDNQLWLRHFLTLVVQSLGVAYVLYKNIARTRSFVLASILIFVVGLLKYGERTWALKCSSWNSILSSIKKGRHFLPKPLPVERIADGDEENILKSEVDDERLLQFAHSQFYICKRAMVDSSSFFPDSGNPVFNELNSDDARKVMEMELTLMYDILYTKAAVIHTWYGYCIRMFSPAATGAAFLLFQIGSKDGYRRIDVAITYVLLIGAFLLDMLSLFRAIGSTWTCEFLRTRRWFRPCAVIMSLRRFVKAGSYREWSGSVGQYDLLDLSTRDQTDLRNIIAKAIGLENWWNKMHYSWTLVLSEDVKKLVFQRVWQILKSTYANNQRDAYSMMDVMRSWGQKAVKSRHEKLQGLDLPFGREFQEDLLVWHIGTEIFLWCSDQQHMSSPYSKTIKMLSKYMMFLASARGHMLPGLVLHSLYEITRRALEKIWIMHRERSISRGESAKLATILYQAKHSDKTWDLDTELTRILSDVIELAIALLDAADTSDMQELLELIFNVWVDKLLYASVQGSKDSHAKQLSTGGELTTIVWIMAQHAGTYRIGEIDDVDPPPLHFPSPPPPPPPLSESYSICGSGVPSNQCKRGRPRTWKVQTHRFRWKWHNGLTAVARRQSPPLSSQPPSALAPAWLVSASEDLRGSCGSDRPSNQCKRGRSSSWTETSHRRAPLGLAHRRNSSF
ncbi:hypothetical protein EJB05_51010, partial [Eragrostis curvula]